MNKLYLNIETAEQMEALGAKLAMIVASCMAGSAQCLVIFLQGDLGAGKTTLTRGFMHGLGHVGAVRSPTYTLVETYMLPPKPENMSEQIQVHHFDLYRLGDPEELEYIGIRDLLVPGSVSLIEWPTQGEGVLPSPDVSVHIDYDGDGRRVTLDALSDVGLMILGKL